MSEMNNNNMRDDVMRTIFVNSNASVDDIETAIETKRNGHFYGTMYLCITDDVVTDDNKSQLLDNASADTMYQILEFRDNTIDVWHKDTQITNRAFVKDVACAIHDSMSYDLSNAADIRHKNRVSQAESMLNVDSMNVHERNDLQCN